MNIGSSIGKARKEWYLRRDTNDEWFGPLSYYFADKQARVATRDGDPTNVKYMQLGTFLGSRHGDPARTPQKIEVVMIYANGKPFLRGRMAEFNKDKLPI